MKRRKYRFRFLDASVARIYEFKLMSSTQGPKSAASLGYTGDELEGQYRIPDGQQCMKFTQIASDGGLLPFPITRDSFELWPAKRREVIVDFTQVPGRLADDQGRRHLPDQRDEDARRSDVGQLLAVPPGPGLQGAVLKFVIGDGAPDDSVIPTKMRPLPPLPATGRPCWTTG